MKKGDIAFSQIVLAALALVVLVVLIMIFTGQTDKFAKIFGKQTEETEKEASETAWCISTLAQGKQCRYDASGCSDVEDVKLERAAKSGDEYTCPEGTWHAIAERASGDNKFCCASRK